MNKLYDLIVIGTGSGGMSAIEAARAAGAKRIAVVEGARRLGGECPNKGCVPTKVLLRSVEVLRTAKRAGEFGVHAEHVQANFKKMRERRKGLVDLLTKPPRIENILKQLGVDLIRGWAKFEDKNTIVVRGKKYQAKKFIIATGAESFIPPIEGLKEAGYLTSDDLIDTERLPKSLVIIGGGPIGSEFAQIFAPLGTKVTLVEFSPHVLSREEPEVARVVMDSFAKQGIKVLTNRKAVKVEKKGRERVVTVLPANEKLKASKRAVRAAEVMIAVGKRPAIKKLGLDALGMKFDKRGGPILTAYLQTSVPTIYMAGDAAGQMLFTHVAHYQGDIAGQNAVRGNKLKSDLSVVPRATFVHPEVGSVGITEAAAQKQGLTVKTGVALMAGLGRALASGDHEGLVKLVVDKKTGLILGGGAVGSCAGELIHEIALAMYAKIPSNKIANMIHAYPTWSEAVGVAAYMVDNA